MRKNTRKNTKKVIKKLSDFVKDEDGFISKESILKIGIGTISVLGVTSSAFAVECTGTPGANSDTYRMEQTWLVSSPNCYKMQPCHESHTSHASY